MAGLLRRFQKHLRHRIDAAQRRDVQWPVRAVIGRVDLLLERLVAEVNVLGGSRFGQDLEALQLTEIGQHVVIAPARIAEVAPMVEILALAADEDLAVDVRGASRALAARQGDRAALQAGFRFSFEPGHEFRPAEKSERRRHEGDHRERNTHNGFPCIAVHARLDQADARGRIFA